MKTLNAILALAVTVPLVAADAVNVKLVNDRRTNGSFSSLRIVLEMPNVKSTDVVAARVLVSSAKDDSGRSLVDTEKGEPRLEPTASGFAPPGRAPEVRPASVDVELKNPDRKATKLTEVRGQIELLVPSKDPNSIAEIPKFLATAGKPMTSKALKANGVEIAILTPAQREAEKKKATDAKRKEAAASGYSGEDLDNYVKTVMESYLSLEDGELLVRLSDPKKAIHQLAYVDGKGETKFVSTSEREGFYVFSTYGEKPEPDWKLRVTMMTAKNIVKQSFALADVALP